MRVIAPIASTGIAVAVVVATTAWLRVGSSLGAIVALVGRTPPSRVRRGRTRPGVTADGRLHADRAHVSLTEAVGGDHPDAGPSGRVGHAAPSARDVATASGPAIVLPETSSAPPLGRGADLLLARGRITLGPSELTTTSPGGDGVEERLPSGALAACGARGRAAPGNDSADARAARAGRDARHCGMVGTPLTREPVVATRTHQGLVAVGIETRKIKECFAAHPVMNSTEPGTGEPGGCGSPRGNDRVDAGETGLPAAGRGHTELATSTRVAQDARRAGGRRDDREAACTRERCQLPRSGAWRMFHGTDDVTQLDMEGANHG